MNKYYPAHVHSMYSLKDGLSTPDQIVTRITKLGLDGCTLTDHNSISGAVKFLKAMNKAGKKPILGSELYICDRHSTVQDNTNRQCSHLVVLAKNNSGWKQLIKIISASNTKDSFYYNPRLSLEELAPFLDGNVIGFAGHMGSILARRILNEDGTLQPQWKQDGINLAKWLENVFGKGNFFIEIQLIIPNKVLIDALREISVETGIPCVATPDAHYAERNQADDQRILICSGLHKTLKECNAPDFGMSAFFQHNTFHIPSYEEMVEFGNTAEELENTNRIADMVEKYDILSRPKPPRFKCPNGNTEESYLRELCKIGWKEKIEDRIPKEKHSIYGDRVKEELATFEKAGISGYFLICADILNYVRRSEWLPGPARGSVAGCLVAYLTNITQIDPIPYNLLLSRFYNDGRNTPERVSYPDIDMDVPANKREQVLEYIKEKYGRDSVAQIVTYQTMKGRNGLKDVLRARGGISFEEMNRLTKHIPDEAKIADELQEMREEEGESSIIKWALENKAKYLAEWCELDEEGNLTGPLAKTFAQAIRLEGTYTAQAKHAAGVVISPVPLNEICPTILDNTTKEPMSGFDMHDLEDIGLLKFDILSLSLLEKIMSIVDILKTGDVNG